jgi:alanine racemase
MLSWLEIDTAAIRSNYQHFLALAAPSTIAPVLKSNAYGHGLELVYRALSILNPPWLCVNYMSEAQSLRGFGYRGRILVVGPLTQEGFDVAAQACAEPVLGNFELLRTWLGKDRPCPIHIKVDTGMSRQGFLLSDLPEVLVLLSGNQDKVVGICTHFANVEDVTDHSYASRQLKEFHTALSMFANAGFKSLLKHAASSASTLIMSDSRLDLDRIGISLYGHWPSRITKVSYLQVNHQVVPLKPVLSWKTKLTTVKRVEPGKYIGYGCTYRATRPMVVGVVPVGYFEGYPRLAGEGASRVLIKGERCAIVGRICMNMMMVDVTHLTNIAVGDTVTLIGQDGEEHIGANDLAEWARTINYEVLSRLHPEIPRIAVS